MDSIADLLHTKQPAEPPQLKAMRDYVLKNHNEKVLTSVGQMGYSMTVSNGILASILQMEMPKIQAECDLDKKLFIRIGHF